MTRVFDEQFEGAGYEETWSAGETISGSATLDEDANTADVSSPPGWDVQCLKAVVAGTENAFVKHDYGSGITNCFVRVYVHCPSEAFSSPQTRIAAFLYESGGTSAMRLYFNKTAGGVFRIVCSAKANGSTWTNHVASYAVGETARFEFNWNNTANTYAIRKNGSSIGSGSLTGSAAGWSLQTFELGPTGQPAAPLTCYYDNFAVDDADWPGEEYEVTPTALDASWAPVTPSITQALTVTPQERKLAWNKQLFAGELNPTATLGPLTVTPGALSATWEAVNGMAQLGTLSVTPAVVNAAWAVVTGTSSLGALTVTPAVLDALWAPVNGSASLGVLTVTPTALGAAWAPVAGSASVALVVTPAALSAAWQAVTGVASLGTLTVSPAAVTAAWAPVAGSASLGTLSVTPSPVTAVWAPVTGTVTLGALSVTPSALAAQWQAVTGSASLGTLTVTPAALDAVWQALAGSVVVGITASPAALNGTWAVVLPSITQGLTVTPDALDLVLAVVNGSAVFGGITVSPSSPVNTTREMRWRVVNPALAGNLTPTHRGGIIVYDTDGIHLAVIGKPSA